ncbi:uncharacterized protein TNCV_2970561 [Trichonephila clavipes]|nr:uncharacterized protein TNCV_2970561 [Trichonephila clavipes]
MASCNHMCCHSCNGSQEPFFNKTMLGLTRQGYHKTISALLLPFLDPHCYIPFLDPHCYYPSLTCPIPRFVSNRAYLGSFGTVSRASHEFERTRVKVTANMEQYVSRHHTDLVCLNARSYRIIHSR